MVGENLFLRVGDIIRLSGEIFTVEGYISFEDLDGNRWIEYKIKSHVNAQVKWLSVDAVFNEYIVYTQKPYSNEFLEDNIINNGYGQVEQGTAKVLGYMGNVDVDIGEKVNFKEYENENEELLISIESWGSEKEYSKGYYIHKNNIEVLDAMPYESNMTRYKKSSKHKGTIGVMAIIIIVIVIAFNINSHDKSLSKSIASIEAFVYETSITSDLEKDIKADVYSTDISIEDATKLIIDKMQGNIEDIQENEEDGAVALLTSDEMAIVYKGEDSKTFIQVSLREYVYSSRSGLYLGSNVSNSYYRNYYFYRGYNKDKNRYNNLQNSYSSYKDGKPLQNDNGRYQTYSDSIRQSSVSSRTSSGDGISSGK